MEHKYAKVYVDAVYDFIDAMNCSDFISKQPDKELLMFTGFKAITNIFQINFINTNDLKAALYSSQKARYFYLEYLEQMQNTNMSHDLDYTDAIQFLYSKTIANYTSTNVAKLSHNVLQIAKVVESIIWFSEQRRAPNKLLVVKMLKMNCDEVIYCLEIAKRRVFSVDEYNVFIRELTKALNDDKKNGETGVNTSLYANKMSNLDVHIHKPVGQFCKWLVSEQ
jgi:hypothetical protein